MEGILFFVLSLMFLWEVQSMALKGPALITYHPCGLGLLHFDKLLDNTWKGVLHFGLYTNLNEADVVIDFQKESTITAVSFKWHF